MSSKQIVLSVSILVVGCLLIGGGSLLIARMRVSSTLDKNIATKPKSSVQLTPPAENLFTPEYLQSLTSQEQTVARLLWQNDVRLASNSAFIKSVASNNPVLDATGCQMKPIVYTITKGQSFNIINNDTTTHVLKMTNAVGTSDHIFSITIPAQKTTQFGTADPIIVKGALLVYSCDKNLPKGLIVIK